MSFENVLKLIFIKIIIPSWKVVGLCLGDVLEIQCRCQVAQCLSTPLSVLCHFVALADCIRSGYVGGQLVITRNILSSYFTIIIILKGKYTLKSNFHQL